jgi:SAM-dependent methyltransferase
MSIAGDQPASAPGIAPMPPAHAGAQFMELLGGSLATHLVDAALKYQLPRRLLDGPRSSMELADMTGLHEPSLYRVLRALTVFGVFTEQPGRRFGLGPLGPTAAQFEDSMDWLDAALKELPSALQTGTTGMQLAHGMSFFEYVSQHPAAGQAFDLAVRLMHDGELEAVAETYDFASVQTVIDVGGGNGTALAAILQRHPHLRGVLFELPAVVERAGAALAEALGERCELVAGDFFKALPVRGDLFLLSRVIHDWDDPHAATILRNCRRAMSEDGKLVLVEMLIPPEDEPHPAKMVDIGMLLLTGGMERTEQQYAELFDAAELKLTRVIPTQSAVSVIEAVPAARG